MKGRSMRLALPTAILAIVLSAPGRAEDAVKADFSPQALQAKIEYCKTCHGVSGQGFHGSTPIPRLAGQQTEYLDNQLRAFIERRRENKYMYNVSHVLSPAMRTALAKHFTGLNAKPLGGAPKELVATGKKIYEEGFPDAQVPPCASCHGPNAEGIRQIPRLGGLSYYYLKQKLEQWREGYHAAAEPPMPRIASTLSPHQIDALASYLSFVK